MLKKSSLFLLRKIIRDVHYPMFHSTRISNARKILDSGFNSKAGRGDANADNAICFTRDLDFTNSSIFGQVTFVVDRQELKQKYRIYSYDWVYKSLIRREIHLDQRNDILVGIMDMVLEKWIHNKSSNTILKELETSEKYIKDILVLDESEEDIEESLCDAIKQEYGFERCYTFEDVSKKIHTQLTSYAKHITNTLSTSGDEFEERVSLSPMGVEGKKVTVIPSKYIKYVIITKKAHYEALKDMDFKFIFADYKHNIFKLITDEKDIDEKPAINNLILEKYPEVADYDNSELLGFLANKDLKLVKQLLDQKIKVHAFTLMSNISNAIQLRQYNYAALLIEYYGALRSDNILEMFIRSYEKEPDFFESPRTMLPELLDAAIEEKCFTTISLVRDMAKRLPSLTYDNRNYLDFSDEQVIALIQATLINGSIKDFQELNKEYSIYDYDKVPLDILGKIPLNTLKFLYQNYPDTLEDWESEGDFGTNVDNVMYLAEQTGEYLPVIDVAIAAEDIEALKKVDIEDVKSATQDMYFDGKNKALQYLVDQGIMEFHKNTRSSGYLKKPEEYSEVLRKKEFEIFKSLLKEEYSTALDLIITYPKAISDRIVEEVQALPDKDNTSLIKKRVLYS